MMRVQTALLLQRAYKALLSRTCLRRRRLQTAVCAFSEIKALSGSAQDAVSSSTVFSAARRSPFTVSGLHIV